MQHAILKQKAKKMAVGIAGTALMLGGGLAAYAQATPPPVTPNDTTPPPPNANTPPVSATTPPAPNYKIQYNGLVDGYFMYQFNNPKGGDGTIGTAFNDYAIRNTSPALSLAEVNVFMVAKPNNLGFKATLTTGDTADINHGGALGGTIDESRLKNIQQLYGTYAFGADGAGLDFGEFYTPFGYEVTESNANYNYTRSDVYFLLPVYHTGARIYTPVPGVAGLTATFYLVRTLTDSQREGVEDENKDPAYIGQLNYAAPGGKFTINSDLGYGKDGSKDGRVKNLINDNDFTYNLNANQLVGLNYAYLTSQPEGSSKTTVNGYAVYYRQQLTPKTAGALRFSGFDAKNDGFHLRPFEITGTYEYKAAANFLTRLEYRYDHSNVEEFLNDNSVPDKKDQNQLIVSGVFTF